MKLTLKMWSMLETALEYDKPPLSIGCFADDAGQRSTIRALVRRGLLEFADYGRDVNGEHENDVAIFKITQAGRNMLAGVEAAK